MKRQKLMKVEPEWFWKKMHVTYPYTSATHIEPHTDYFTKYTWGEVGQKQGDNMSVLEIGTVEWYHDAGGIGAFPLDHNVFETNYGWTISRQSSKPPPLIYEGAAGEIVREEQYDAFTVTNAIAEQFYYDTGAGVAYPYPVIAAGMKRWPLVHDKMTDGEGEIVFSPNVYLRFYNTVGLHFNPAASPPVYLEITVRLRVRVRSVSPEWFQMMNISHSQVHHHGPPYS